MQASKNRAQVPWRTNNAFLISIHTSCQASRLAPQRRLPPNRFLQWPSPSFIRKRAFHKRFCSWTGRLLLVQVFYLLVSLLNPQCSQGQVSAGGLRTRVNGSAYGQCAVGTCTVNGGLTAGPNLFQRFSRFDTRNGVKAVRLHTNGKRNLILGVTHPEGTFINRSLLLSSPANVYWLSPRGIWIGSGANFVNVPNLLLSTGHRLRIGSTLFDVFQSEDTDITRLNNEPLPITSVRQSDGRSLSFSIESSGDGSIVFAGGLLSVERGLLVDARGGGVTSQPGGGTQLQAGHSVVIAGQQVDLKDVQIKAGHANELGVVDIHTNSEGDQAGSIAMNQVGISGQQVSIAAGNIDLQNSHLQTPNGTIKITSVNPSGQPNQIRIANSVLDVGVHGLNDLTQLPLKSVTEGNTQGSSELTSIRLISNGNIAIKDSTLSTATDLSSLKDLPASLASKLDTLPARSGQIFLDAEGQIDIRSSLLTADASHGLAGQIGLRTRQGAPEGGVTISNSAISASFGLGKGEITLFSHNGISISDSTLRASNNRYPVVNGSALAATPGSDSRQLLPLSFNTGKIWLINLSPTDPITIHNSSLAARQTTSGGPLASKFFTDIRPVFTDGQSRSVGHDGQFKGINAYRLDYEFYASGGVIEIISSGGINIEKSQLDVSSRDERSHAIEATSGRIGVVNTGHSDLSIRDSNLFALSGFARDPAITRLLAGYITLGNMGRITLSKTNIDASNSNAGWSFDQTDYSYPYLQALSFSSLNLDPTTTLNASVANSSNLLQTASQGTIELYQPSPHPRYVQQIQPAPQLLSGEDINANYISAFLKDYRSFATDKAEASLLGKFVRQGSTFNPIQSPALNFQAFNQPPQIRSGAADSSRSAPVEIEQQDIGRQFLDAQDKSMRETMERLGLSADSGKRRSIQDLQRILVQARTLSPPSSQQQRFAPSSDEANHPDFYNPAIIHLQKDAQPSGMVRITAILLTAEGEPISSSVDISRTDLDAWIKRFQRRLSRREIIQASRRDSPAAKTVPGLLQFLLPTLKQQRITALLLEVDRGLQAIPYGALPLDGRLLGESFALTITPSLGLIDLDPSERAPRPPEGQMLLVGASAFSNGLEPLPMVRQELSALAAEHPSTLLLDEAFTPSGLVEKARAERVRQLHIATHANFQPGQTSNGVLYTPTTSLSLAELGRGLRSRAISRPLDLMSLSGCVTALGDEQSELGFVGMALQAGARSGLGTLWEVDDTATAAFFIQFYRYIKQGLSKDQALQATQRAFLRREVRLQGAQLVGPDPAGGSTRSTLVSGLSREERTLFAQGLDHPYFWAGMVLSGSPW